MMYLGGHCASDGVRPLDINTTPVLGNDVCGAQHGLGRGGVGLAHEAEGHVCPKTPGSVCARSALRDADTGDGREADWGKGLSPRRA